MYCSNQYLNKVWVKSHFILYYKKAFGKNIVETGDLIKSLHKKKVGLVKHFYQLCQKHTRS